jgi:hypothetical protein
LKLGENHEGFDEERCPHEYIQDVHVEMVAGTCEKMEGETVSGRRKVSGTCETIKKAWNVNSL